MIANKLIWMAVLFLVFASANANAQEEDKKELIELLTCEILVVDPDGNPVDDATVYCSGIRTKIAPGSHWGWDEKTHGPMPKLKTGEDGIVEMPYPKYVEEKLETGQMTWTVEHPDFVDFREDRSVDGPAEIKLARGFKIAATAINSETGEKIAEDLYAVISGSRADWQLKSNGMLVSPTFAKQVSTLRLCQFKEGQPTLFSEMLTVDPGEGSRVLLKDIKLSVGTRVEGKLADSIPRPIKNGFVIATIVRKKGNDWSSRWNWSDKTTINEDGTFVFESLPSDEVLQLIPICDGWVPSKPKKETVLKFFPESLRVLDGGMAIPQVFELSGQSITATLEMEKSTSLKVTLESPDGQPLVGAKIVMWPNQLWFDGGSQVLGDSLLAREYMTKTRAGNFEWDRKFRFQATSDEQGIGTIHNLPQGSESLMVAHDDFQMPITANDSRTMRVDLKPGVLNEVTVKMQMKGSDELGGEELSEDK